MTPLLSADATRLLSTVPTIRRARGWRLYTTGGARILDLFAEGGRLVFGHGGGGSGRVAKEMIDRSLLSPFPSFWRNRLEKQILSWRPGYEGVVFFPSEFEALVSLASMDTDFSSAARAGIPLREGLASLAERLPLEVPFGEYLKKALPLERSSLAGKYALAILPVASAWSLGAVLAKTNEDARALASRSGALNSAASPGPVPALRLAAGARALADFSAREKTLGEKTWAAIDPFIEKIFLRSGPWLYPRYSKAEHGGIFAACLQRGILISPDYDSPSLVPGEFDAGEVVPLRGIVS